MWGSRRPVKATDRTRLIGLRERLDPEGNERRRSTRDNNGGSRRSFACHQHQRPKAATTAKHRANRPNLAVAPTAGRIASSTKPKANSAGERPPTHASQAIHNAKKPTTTTVISGVRKANFLAVNQDSRVIPRMCCIEQFYWPPATKANNR